MSYNHKSTSIKEALGIDPVDVFDKAQTIIDTLSSKEQEVISRRVEILEKNLNSKELAILTVMLTKVKSNSKSNGTINVSSSGVSISEIEKEDLPPEVLKAIEELFSNKDFLKEVKEKKSVFKIITPSDTTEDVQCNCAFCKLERELKAISLKVPISRGGDA